ncbi:MAG: PilT/PilU family type 4a pilus ATPase [Candidatus Peribacteraceae bacterium]|nr:PilT/PilU family type 4a pilus ATPase [Candidatus Peribacteraceae bacterium]
MTPKEIFEEAGRKKASDVHIVVGHPILLRIDGVLVEQGKEILTPEGAEKFVRAVLGEENWKRFEKEREIDVSYAVGDGVRLRVNCHYERGNVGLVARIIPSAIPSLEDVGLDDKAKGLCMLTNGLILLTGPTGSGKSTSLAAMIQYINQTREASIVTLEDPIEFLFPKGRCVIRQRQYGDDFTSFPEALKRVLRQDPNIVMVGEMRDLPTIAAALTLAETGHLIFATLHTPNAVQSIDRIVDVFPPHQQHQIRTQLSLSLKAVIAQQLVPGADGGRIAVREVLINTPAVSNIIREGRSQELPTVLQTGGESGMRTFEKEAKRLLDAGKISIETFERIRG